MPALSISPLLHWRLSRAYLFTDVVVLLLSLSYIPVMRIAFSLITVTTSSYLIDWIRAYGLEKEATEKDRQSPQAETRLSAEAAD